MIGYSLTGDVVGALATRLRTITLANNYPVELKKVFDGRMPMSMDLQKHEMPAVLIFLGPNEFKREQGMVNNFLKVNLEIVAPQVADDLMHQYVRMLGKCIFANSPTGKTNSDFRFHPSVVECWIESVNTDFNMIEGNRIWEVVLMIHYRSRFTDL